MSEPYIGEIRIFGGNFAPRGWMTCSGQILAIRQNTALFAVLGVTYGGNGTTTFGLPDFRGMAPMQQGAGPGLTERSLGETGGETSVTLTLPQMAAHIHSPGCYNDGATAASPVNNVWSSGERGSASLYQTTKPTTAMNPIALGPAGSGNPHDNMQPYLGLTFIIAVEGIFPPRS